MNGPVVGQQDITEMQKLLNIMNGVAPAVPATTGTPSVAQKTRPVEVQYTGPSAPDSNDMKRILESFYGAAGDAVETLNERAAVTSQIAEAMQTTRTDEGVLIGRWEVRVRVAESATSGNTRKLYDVVNPTTREVVADRLYVYEAAHAVVRYLNKGLELAHNKVQEVLDLEEAFRRNRQDAARFKQRFDRCMQLGEQQAADVFESRYQVARANALAASDSIKSILDNIR